MEQIGTCTAAEQWAPEGVLTLALAGELDAASASPVSTFLEGFARTRGTGVLRLEVTDLRFLDVVGARALRALAERLQRAGVRVEVAGATGIRQRVLRIVGCPLLERRVADPAGGADEADGGVLDLRFASRPRPVRCLVAEVHLRAAAVYEVAARRNEEGASFCTALGRTTEASDHLAAAAIDRDRSEEHRRLATALTADTPVRGRS